MLEHEELENRVDIFLVSVKPKVDYYCSWWEFHVIIVNNHCVLSRVLRLIESW